MVLMPSAEEFLSSVGLATMACGTDNKGNSFFLGKLMTTKYPIVVVLMELSCHLWLRRAALHARWLPRLQNEEADARSNEDLHHFDERMRISVGLEKLGFVFMNDLFDADEAYFKELDDLNAQANVAQAAAGPAQRARKPKAGQTLRERQPW